MNMLNIYFAWVWILAGLLSGVLLGLYFHDEKWLGGYASWQRRMLRLGHISFFGTGFLNLAYAMSLSMFASDYASYLWIAGAITMPLICFLSAYKKTFRHLFFIPVILLIAGTAATLWQGAN
jgi:hypothetical protein